MTDICRKIVIIPPPEVIEEAERRNKLVTAGADRIGAKNNIHLDHTQGKWPYITLHELGLPKANEHKIEGIVRDVAQGVRRFMVNLQEYRTYNGVSVCWAEGIDSPDHYSIHDFLHARLVTGLDRLREGIILPKYWPLFSSASNITNQERILLGTYGSAQVFGAYVPHIELGCTDNEDAELCLEGLPPEAAEFVVCSIHIAEINPEGAFVRSLTEIPLKE